MALAIDLQLEERIIDELIYDCWESDSESSGSDEESSDDEIINLKARRVLSRIPDYIGSTVHRYDHIEFRQNFRLSRETSYFLIDEVKNANVLPTHFHGREKVTAEKSVLMTLWYLGNSESFRQISDRFNVTRSCAHSVIIKIIQFLVQQSAKYIKLPDIIESEEIVAGFQRLQGINAIVGAIDGSHIKILKPKNDQEAYCNRKGYHSILIQAVVDHKKRFRDVFCGEAGSIHDARLLKRSSLYQRCSEGSPLGNNVVLGDSAYPNLPWLVPPFKDNGFLTDRHRSFNYKHSATRIVVENAFGLLKGRFRRCKSFENINIKLIVHCVIAACVLHNMCIQFDDLGEEFMDNDDDFEEFDCNDYYEHFEVGRDRRQELFTELFPDE